VTPEPYDSAELDALIELERSPGYALIRARYEFMLERKRQELEKPHDEAKTAQIRGEIAMLRDVFWIIENLKQEILAQLKE
jgi:hypothetical protein